MKKHVIFIYITLFLISNSFGQWTTQPVGIISTLYKVQSLGSNICIIVDRGNGILWKTSNGGNTWFSIQPPSGFAGFSDNMLFLDINTGFISASNTTSSALLKTTNGGLNWQTVKEDLTSIGQVFFLNSNIGWCYFHDPNNKLFKTTNGGDNWNQISDTLDTGGKLYFYNESTGYTYTGGENYSRIYKTTNSGFKWSLVYQTGSRTTDVAFVDSLTFYKYWYINPTGYIGKSTNSGVSWITQYQITGNFFARSHFYNSNTGWVTGGGGLILHTTNGGIVWNNQPSGTTYTLNNISFYGKYTGWAVGENGTVLKTTNGGSVFIQPISSEIPDKYSLNQNYPNPFNPSTNIQFAIMKASNVKFLLYDITGKEIGTLLDEKLQAGTYKVKWNGAKYSSGIYFYKIQTDEFTETKRMTLIK